MPVNWENAEKLLDVIDANWDNFNMGHFQCGSSACIAGWAWRVFGNRPLQSYESAACEYLNLPYDNHTYERLFAPSTFGTLHPTTDDIRARLKELDNETQ